MPRLHMILGDKGRIGKSFIDALLSQYYLDNVTDTNVACLDLDPRTEPHYQLKLVGSLRLKPTEENAPEAVVLDHAPLHTELNVEHIGVQQDGDIKKMESDLFINRVMTVGDDDEVIADMGGNIYISLTDYLRVNSVLQLMMMSGVEVILHNHIFGAGDLFPTLKTLDELVPTTPEGAMISVWINQKNGRVEYNGKQFEESERYEDYKSRIRSVTYIPLWRSDMQTNVAVMLEEAVTFNETLRMDTFYLMGKQRLSMAHGYREVNSSQ